MFHHTFFLLFRRDELEEGAAPDEAAAPLLLETEPSDLDLSLS